MGMDFFKPFADRNLTVSESPCLEEYRSNMLAKALIPRALPYLPFGWSVSLGNSARCFVFLILRIILLGTTFYQGGQDTFYFPYPLTVNPWTIICYFKNFILLVHIFHSCHLLSFWGVVICIYYSLFSNLFFNFLLSPFTLSPFSHL